MTKEEWLDYLPSEFKEFYLDEGFLTDEHLKELHRLNHEWLWVNYLEIHNIYEKQK